MNGGGKRHDSEVLLGLASLLVFSTCGSPVRQSPGRRWRTSPLATLKALEWVMLTDTQVTDTSPLAGLPQLEQAILPDSTVENADTFAKKHPRAQKTHEDLRIEDCLRPSK